MSLFRIILFGLLTIFASHLKAEIIFDHQLVNFITNICKFDIHNEYSRIFQDTSFTHKRTLTEPEKAGLKKLKEDFWCAFHHSAAANLARVPNKFTVTPKTIEEAIWSVRNSESINNDDDQAYQTMLNVYVRSFEKTLNNGDDQQIKRVVLACNEMTEHFFLTKIFEIYLSFFDPAAIESRLAQAKENEFAHYMQQVPFVCIDVDLQNDYVTLQTNPYSLVIQIDEENEETTDQNGNKIIITSMPYEMYRESVNHESTWKKIKRIGMLGLVVGSGAYILNSVFGNSTSAPMCGADGMAGPGCVSADSLVQRTPFDYRAIDNSTTTLVVTGDCSYGQGCSSTAFIGGKNTKGDAYCSPFNVPYGYGVVGQLAPGAWHCPQGKTPFHFLQDGRLCLNGTPVVRAGVDTEGVCDTKKPYCQLPDGLMLYRHGNDLLLTPPCGHDVKICNVGDLKLYRHQDGSYKKESPCNQFHDGGLCIFGEDALEFFNDNTQEWQTRPVDYRDDVTIYRFRNGQVMVFCHKDGSCSLRFPCQFKDGVCSVDSTKFYTKKDSRVWTEGMPCGANEAVCVLENDQAFYPHIVSGGITWQEVPQWTGETTNGLYVGHNQTFVPNADCTAWIPMNNDGSYVVSEEGLQYVKENGSIKYWHTNQAGKCGWSDVPMCLGNQDEGICIGADGKVFILNQDCTQWIPEPETCQHETSLFCRHDDGTVSYWHRGLNQRPGSWQSTPDCNEFADQGYCQAPDGRIFTCDTTMQRCEVLENPDDTTKSQLILLRGGNFATWSPVQSKWLINQAPCTDQQFEVGYCTLDDGNDLYAYTMPDGAKLWLLQPCVDSDVKVIRFKDGSRRWREVPYDAWSSNMPCPVSREQYVVERDVYEAAQKNATTDGQAQIMLDEDTCRTVKLSDLRPYCKDCSVLPEGQGVVVDSSDEREQQTIESGNLHTGILDEQYNDDASNTDGEWQQLTENEQPAQQSQEVFIDKSNSQEITSGDLEQQEAVVEQTEDHDDSSKEIASGNSESQEAPAEIGTDRQVTDESNKLEE